MKTELKKSLSNKKTPLIISFLCIIFGALCGFVGEIFLPLPIAFFAALYLFDNSSGHIVSVITSALLVVMNGVGLLFGLTLSAFGPASVILAYIIYYAFTRKQAKSDASFVMTVICAAFSLVGYILIAMSIESEYTMDAVYDFYGKLTSMLRESFVSLMLEAYASAGIAVTEELVVETFNAQLNMIISYLLIGAFIIVGLSFKLFGFIVKKCTEDKEEISSWRFFTSNLFAYCYVFIGFASMFMASYDSLISVVALNLYNLFMVVYAYVGFNAAYAMLKKKFKPFVSFVLLAAALLIFASFGVQVLAMLGVLFTITKNNEAALTGNQ